MVIVRLDLIDLTGLIGMTLSQKMVGFRTLPLLDNDLTIAVAVLVGNARSGIRTTIVGEMCAGEVGVHRIHGLVPMVTIGRAIIVNHEQVGTSFQCISTEIDPVLRLLNLVDAHLLTNLTGTPFFRDAGSL